MRAPILLSLPLLFMLAACAAQERTDNTNARAGSAVEAWNGELPFAQPWLKTQLPPGTLVYQRVPNPLALFAMPKGNLLDTALGSEANIRNLLNIRQGMADNLPGDVPLFTDPRFRLLTENLSSPIEMAVVGLPQISGVLGMTLDLHSRAEVEALLAELSQFPPIPNLMAPLDAEGFGQLAAPIPVFVHFDEASGRLAVHGGPMASRAGFAALLAAEPVSEPAMAALEQQIDQSGQGYFSWVDMTQVLGLGSMAIPPETMQMLRSTGLAQIQALAFGAGAANGKSRLKLIADFGNDSSTRLIPILENRITATSVGEPRSLFVLSIPSAEEFARLENLALANFPPEIREQWNGLKADLAESIGASVEEILSAVGPELITIHDQAGSYSGLRVRNRALLDDVLERLAGKAGVDIDNRRVDGQRIRYVSLHGSIGAPEGANLPPEAQALLSMLGRLRTRLYWVDEGDYLYVAGIPQLLMDRAALQPDTSVASWLRDTQRIDLSNALLGATGTVANLPRLMYQAYVGLMQGLADLTGAEYDIWSMPTASQLGLPERGTLGFSMNLGEPYVSMELTFEAHPAEVLLAGGGSMAAVAAAGVVAAVALPAYQDYTIRAQVSQGLSLAQPVRLAVEQAFRNTGNLPADRAAAGLAPDAGLAGNRFVTGLEIDNGHILIAYGNAALPRIAGRYLELRPQIGADGALAWRCGYAGAGGLPPDAGGAAPIRTTIEPKYLPSGCR